MNKKEILMSMFEKIGVLYIISDILLETGIESEKSLRTYCWDLRKKGIMDLKIKWGTIRRIK